MSSPRPGQERTPPKTPKERKPRKRKPKRENEKNQEEVGGANGNVDGQAAINPDVTFGKISLRLILPTNLKPSRSL
jgi:hypothetical protein